MHVHCEWKYKWFNFIRELLYTPKEACVSSYLIYMEFLYTWAFT